MKKGKNYRAFADAIEDRTYPIEEAIEVIKEHSKRKFDESIEVHVRLGIDPKRSEQFVRGTTILPHGTGKSKKVIAFVNPAKEEEAKKAGADMIGDSETIKEIGKTKKTDFDVAVAVPDMMRLLGPIAQILGQRGLMPNPKTETVGPNIGKIIEELKGGKVAFKNDDTANIHQVLGKVSWSKEKLVENISDFVDAVKKAKPEDLKGTYIKKVTLTTSMGPGIQIQR